MDELNLKIDAAGNKMDVLKDTFEGQMEQLKETFEGQMKELKQTMEEQMADLRKMLDSKGKLGTCVGSSETCAPYTRVGG